MKIRMTVRRAVALVGVAVALAIGSAILLRDGKSSARPVATVGAEPESAGERKRSPRRAASPDLPPPASADPPAAQQTDRAPAPDPVPPGFHRVRAEAADGRDTGPWRAIVRFVAGDPEKPGAVADLRSPGGPVSVESALDVASIDVLPDEPGDPPLLAVRGFAPSAGTRDHVVVLARGARLRVRALRPDDVPLAGAALAVRGRGSFSTFVRCDAEGRASADVPQDDVFEAAIVGDAVEVSGGEVRRTMLPFSGVIRGIRPGEEAVLRAEAIGVEPLQVRVRTPEGRPAAGVRVTVRLDPYANTVADAVTAADGTALVQGLPVRPYRIELGLPADGPLAGACVAPPLADAVPGGDVHEISLLAARSLGGMVVDDRGAPCKGAVVAVLRRGTEIVVGSTGDDGAFTLALPESAAGPLTVTARVYVQGGPPLDGSTGDVHPGDAAVRVVVQTPR